MQIANRSKAMRLFFFVLAGVGLFHGTVVGAPQIEVVDIREQRPSSVTSRPPTPADRRPAASGDNGFFHVQLEELRQEVMELRGLLEVQENTIKQMQEDSRHRYHDLNERLAQSSAAPLAPHSPSHPPEASSQANHTALQPPSQSVADPGEQLYRRAFGFIQSRQFKPAAENLVDYLNRYPQGPFADNSQYWLGEINLAQGELASAQKAFETLIKRHPDSGKLADASYKLARVYDAQGKKKAARARLHAVIREHPGSSAARLAEDDLINLQN